MRKPSVTTITSDNPDSSLVGENVAVFATVTGAGGAPTGSVTVVSDSLESCTIASLTGGSGSCVISFADVGAKMLTATYSGEADFEASADTEPHQVMASTTTTISSDDPDPSVAGQPVTVAYSVSHLAGTAPLTGTVTVGDGVDSCSAPVAAGQCSMALSTLGARTLTASYSGDANYRASSATAAHAVRGNTTTTINSDAPDPSVGREAVVVTVTTAPVAPAIGTATGMVDVSDGTATTCTVTLSGGTGSCTLTFNTIGSKWITASYRGDADFIASTSAGEAHAVTNTNPNSSNDTLTTEEDVAGTVSVLSNDSDPDGHTLSVTAFTQGAIGTVVCTAAGICAYTPNADESGADSFTYTLSDGFGGSATASVTVTIDAVNDAPVGVRESYSVAEDGDLEIAAPGVLANDADVEGDTLSAEATRTPSHGTLVLQPIGSFSYEPDPDFNGSDSFEYRAFDGTAESNTVTVSLRVSAINDAPVAVRDSFTTLQGVTLEIAAPGVLGNDTDADSEALTALMVTPTNSGGLTLDSNGSFQYRPDPGHYGSDSFTYYACDASVCGTPATVTIEVAASDSILAVIGSTAGPGASSFLTSMHLFNDTDAVAEGELDIIGASAGKRTSSVALHLAPREARYIQDVMALAGLTGLASANLHMTRGPLPVSVIHVYNDAGDLGTSGLLERPIPLSKVLRTGDRAVLIAPADPVATRMNIGVRSLLAGISLRLTLRDASGVEKVTIDRSYAGSTFLQSSAAEVLGLAPAASDSITIEVLEGSCILYASATDNRTNDPNIQFASLVGVADERIAVDRVILVAGSTQGAFGSRFKTAAQIHNAGDTEMTGSITFHSASTGGSAASPTLPLRDTAHGTMTIDDVLPAMGVPSGLGTLDLATNGSVEPIAVVRVYSVSETGEYSLTEDLLTIAAALDAGETGAILAPHDPSRMRFNIGVRTLAASAKVNVVVRNATGAIVHEAQLVYPPRYFAQRRAEDHLGVTLGGDESVTYTVIDGSAIVYGTWTDNITQDPSLHIATSR